jgi:ribonuclease III
MSVKPPPPRYPPPNSLTEEEEENLIPGQWVELTREILEEHILGFRTNCFPNAYLQAFTHKSAASFFQRQSYERLEFLGDSIINFCTAKFLYDLYPHAQEGDLTKLRTRLCRSEALATLARHLHLESYVFMSGKALYRNWNTNTRILEDVFEALIGAIYIDQGLAPAKEFFTSVLLRWTDFNKLQLDFNYKDQLMRYCHAHSLPLPSYECTDTMSKDAGKLFLIRVQIRDKHGYGKHRVKKAAEQDAALAVLKALNVPVDEIPA